ncbi:plastocyanin [Streptomyces sp. NBC_00178]|uniref:plastocyanin n=1 Tax=Streptomyces sp. NBC_00178 TaxID=2975672 RepID=UPI002E2E1F8F|nr:plastocyanin [Streptomyces sp. NBC_00178]
MNTYTVKVGSDAGRLAFQPGKLTVAPGDTIEWVCNAQPPHNIVFDPAKNPNGDSRMAKTLSHTTPMTNPGDVQATVVPRDAPPGDYHFYSEPHRDAGMEGILTVTHA